MARLTIGSVGTWMACSVSAGALVGCAGALRHAPGPALAIPSGSVLEAEVAAGYEAYGSVLERWGRWSDDPLYGRHWCPRVDPATFVPYRSNGHWNPSATPASTSGWGAEEGAPSWASNDADTWGDITMHHGWWVHLDTWAPVERWCWIPGTSETAARVVWRVADGFVAWAPEPPAHDDDDSDDSLNWSYELLGTLFEDLLDGSLLNGDAASNARAATWAARKNGAVPRHLGPGTAQVAQARKALTDYVVAHPVVTAQAALRSTSTSHAESGPIASADHEAAATASRSSKTASTSTHAASTEQLPSGMVIYEQLSREPLLGGFGYGPGAYLPMVGAGRALALKGGVSSSNSNESHGYSTSSSTSTPHTSSHHGSHPSTSSGSSSSSKSSSHAR